jgi:single-strand DNA-binding protein
MNRRWKSPDGQMKEEVCFVDCRCYQRGAETINQYMTKGRPILIEGRLRLDQWESKEGQKRSRLYVVVDQFQFLGGPRGEGGQGAAASGGGNWSRDRAAGGRATAPAAEPIEDDAVPPPPDEGGAREEIPF